MDRIFAIRDIIGFIKDKASLSKAAVLSKPRASTLCLAVLRATTHSPPSPSDGNSLTSLLILGDASRAVASAIVTALMNRLRRTSSCIVALKCLLIIHHIIKRGPFILQDQLSAFPVVGRRNNLKLSAFHDGASAETWALSAWVRWYARYLETLLLTSRILGYFICSSSDSMVKEIQEQRIPCFLNADLIKDIDSLALLIEEICEIPDSLLPGNDILVKEIWRLSLNDYLSTINEILTRTQELKQRLDCLEFGDAVELTCSLKRLQDCRERLSDLHPIKKTSISSMWASVEELKDGIGMLKVYREGGKLVSYGRREKMSESARFDERVLKSCDSIQFPSGRIVMNRLSTFSVSESVESNFD